MNQETSTPAVAEAPTTPEGMQSAKEDQVKQYGQAMIGASNGLKIENGNILTPGDQEHALAYRQDHGGHSSNETATKI